MCCCVFRAWYFRAKKEGNLIFLTFTIELNEKVANYLHIQIEK